METIGVGVVGLLIVVMIHHWWRNRNAIVTRWPILGMLPTLLLIAPNVHDYLTELMSKCGGTFEFEGPLFCGMDFIITAHPLNLQHIYSTKFSNYPKGDEFREMHDVLGDGFINVDSDLWRLQRKMFLHWQRRFLNFDSFVETTLYRKVVDELIPFFDHASQTRIQVDLQEALGRITFDNAILYIFGLDLSSYSFKSSKCEYQKAFKDIEEAVFQRHILPKSYWKLQRWLQIGNERKLRKAQEKFDEFIIQCISLKQEQMSHANSVTTNNDNDEEACLGLLTIYMEEKEKPYSDKFLRDVAFNFLTAARDTLTTGLCWFFWFVMTHPDIETRILKEMKEKLGGNNCSSINYYKDSKELSKLVYLQAAIYETLRLYPSLPFNQRTPTKADVFPSGHQIKSKQTVLTSAYSTGRMEEVWGKDCLEFKPERWISEEGEFIYVPSHKFPAFHIGPRTCMGKDMALIQMKVMALTLLQNYQFRNVEGHQVHPNVGVLVNMIYGLKITISKRY